jgi:hypothetical protein
MVSIRLALKNILARGALPRVGLFQLAFYILLNCWRENVLLKNSLPLINSGMQDDFLRDIFLTK